MKMTYLFSIQDVKSLTGIRWVAAFYVFIFHCQVHLGKVFSWEPLACFIGNGATAMSLFFILSGWILAHVYKPGHFELRDFYLKRFSRVYPCYLVYGLLSIPIILFHNIEYKFIFFEGTFREIINFMYALCLFIFMLQAWLPLFGDYWNFGGSWSLSVEAFFYFLFPFLRQLLNEISRQGLNLIMIATLVFSIAPFLGLYLFSNKANFQTVNAIIYINPMLRLPEFLLGMVGYILTIEYKQYIFSNPKIFKTLFIIFIVFLSIPLSFISYNFYSIITVPFFVSFIAFAHTSNGLISRLLSSSYMNYLGKVSYSFYLSQFVAFSVFKEYLINNNNTFIRWFYAFTLTFILSLIVYYFVEIPFRQKLRMYIHVKNAEVLSN